MVADANPPYKDLIGQTLNGKKMRDASGSGTAGPIWETAMQLALRGLPSSKFVQPDDKTIRGNVKDLPYLKGMTPVDATAKLLSMGFKAAISPTPVDSDAPAGTVASTTPRQEDGAPEGATVTLVLSNGSKAPPTGPHTADHPATAGYAADDQAAARIPDLPALGPQVPEVWPRRPLTTPCFCTRSGDH